MVTDGVRFTLEIKSRIAVAKAAFNEKRTLFHQQTGLIFKEETNKALHLEHSF
jgi:hypothetical protein